MPRLSETIERIVHQSGFKINYGKIRFRGKNEQQTVTGVVVNEKPNVSRKERRKIRAGIHQYKTGIIQEELISLKPQLRGKIAYVQSVNPEQGAKLLSQFKGFPSSLPTARPEAGAPGRP